MCYPTTLALIAALWTGPARTKAIALWSAIGGAFAASVHSCRAPCSSTSGGAPCSSSPCPSLIAAFAMAYFLVPDHVSEGTEPVDNLGGVLSIVLVGRADPRHQLRRRPERRRARARPHRCDGRRAGRVRPPPTPRRQSPLRPQGGGPTDVLGRRASPASSCSARSWARCSSVNSSCRTCSATPPSRRARRSCPPRHDGARRAALGKAGRRDRVADHVADRLRVRVPRASSRCCCVEEGIPYWKVGLGYALRRHRRRVRRDAGRALAHGLGPVPIGSGWRPVRPTCSATSAARSCSRSSARCSRPATPRR